MSAAAARRTALVLALDLGILGDYLLRADGEPGLNLSLWAGAGVAAVYLVRKGREGLPREIAALLGAALLFGAALAWRDAAALRVLNLLVAAGLATLAGGAAAGGWLREAGVVDYLAACSRSALSAVAGPVMVVRGTPALWSSPAWSRPALAALRGALLAVPLLLLFGSLLAAADPVFATLAGDVLAFDPDAVLSHAVPIVVLGWGSAGHLSRYLGPTPTSAAPLPFPLPRPRVGLVDGAVALGLLNALFLVFVAVQLRYLFGGAGLVQVTPGLTYAEYARQGFFELVGVATLVVPLLLLADWTVRRERFAEQWLFRGLALGQVLLLFAILGSAAYRMRMYWQTYGLTELRLYASVFMVWIALVLLWLVATVLRGRRERFAFGALAAGLAAALCLNLVDPQALIVRVNAARVTAGAEYDVAYAGQLSGDAVPALIRSMDRLPATQRCRLADALLERWGQERRGGWRTFNYGDWRARRGVTRARAALTAATAPCVRTSAKAGSPP
jgi:hypothetical protein